MKVQINITISDQTSVASLAAQGLSPETLLELYEAGFSEILHGVAHPGVKVDMHVVVSDNTEEAEG